MKKATFIPILVFVVLVGFLFVGLKRDPKELPSQFINQPAPSFVSPQLFEPERNFSPADMVGQVWLLNVWASWCVACQIEHPVLLKLAQSKTLPIVGLDYKDKAEDGKKWLGRYGNPYTIVATDADGRIGINYGVYGVPETYLIDKKGIIRDKIVGPVTDNILQDRLLPKIVELQKEGA